MARQNTKAVGIILAAGKGTRINSKTTNKVAYEFNGKPMILYGVELMKGVASDIVVVIGAYADSVKRALKGRRISFAEQKQRLGTAHAVKVALRTVRNNDFQLVLVGYGDHMMFYKKGTIKKMVDEHIKNHGIISFITTSVDDPSGYGRVERDASGNVMDIVEEKDATPKQRKIKEINAGLYCFDRNFLESSINLISKSKVTGEYYLTDVIKIACLLGFPVLAYPVPFEEVGIGVNRHEELEESQKFHKSLQK